VKWVKKGLVYGPDGTMPWARHSALAPTPVLFGDVIRVYAGFRDVRGVSRIGYVDVDANEPSRVLAVSGKPAIDIGIPGTFDDNGVILGDIVRENGQLRMFYVGFQLVEKVKFLAFSGVAVSDEGGNSFTRVKNTPILDRSDEGIYIRAIHTVLVENGIWRIWYSVGNEWTFINGMPYPNYHIRYNESKDGMSFEDEGTVCITQEHNEYRIGRPRVYKQGDLYTMFYTKGTLSGEYVPGYAESDDGVNWQRMDDTIGICPSDTGWDSHMLCYPSMVEYKDRVYMFYNGDNYGEAGFGYAVLEK
jgi:predicted GH43/DUF377 family glycosyl hydrolase